MHAALSGRVAHSTPPLVGRSVTTFWKTMPW